MFLYNKIRIVINLFLFHILHERSSIERSDFLAVLKNKTQGLYVNVSKDILLDQKLSLRDRGMLVTILSLSDNWDFNLKGFSKILPDGVDCIASDLV